MSIPPPEVLMALPPSYLAEDIGHRPMTTAITFIVVNTIVLSLYVTSRILHGSGHGWVTYSMISAAWVCLIGLCVAGILCVQIGGMGRHLAYILSTEPIAFRRFLELQTAISMLYTSACMFSKVALLTLYLRVFTDRKVRLAAWAVAAVLVLTWLSSVVLSFTDCRPFAFKFDKTIPDGECVDFNAVFRYYSVPNVITDVAILLLPISTIWKLQIGVGKKFGLFLTFLVGGLGIVVAVIRMVVFFKTDYLEDSPFNSAQTMITTIAEPSAYFICACLPGIRPLAAIFGEKTGLTHYAQSIWRSMSQSTWKESRKSATRKAGLGNQSSERLKSLSEDRVGFVELRPVFSGKVSRAEHVV